MFNATRYKNTLTFYTSADSKRLIDEKVKLINMNLPHQQYLDEVENIKSEVARFIKDERNKYSNESARLHELFEQDMVEEFNLLQFPFSIISKIHGVAWEKGHSGGYAEVYNCYFDIVDFAYFIMKHAKDI